MFMEKPLKVDNVSIYIIRGKVYIPSTATYPSIVVDNDPVYVSNLDVNEMIPAINKARASGWVELPETESHEKILKRAEMVLLKATKTRSWKELARSGPAYIIDWIDDKIRLSMSELDKRGRYKFPRSKEKLFSIDTPLEDVLNVIMIDLNHRAKKQNIE